jgi:hypothetical protein
MQQDSSNISPIKAIHDLARRNKVRSLIRELCLYFFNNTNQIVAEYQLEKESGPAHAKIYTVQLRLGEKVYTGVDRSIKLAQRAAAKTALDDDRHSLSINNSDKKINSTCIFIFKSFELFFSSPMKCLNLQLLL